MKAVTWHGKRDVRVDTVPDPKVEESTDAIIEVTSTNICGSDLHLYEVLGLSTRATGAETVSAESVSTVPRKALILVFCSSDIRVSPARHGVLHTRSTSSDRGDLPQALPGGGLCADLARRVPVGRAAN